MFLSFIYLFCFAWLSFDSCCSFHKKNQEKGRKERRKHNLGSKGDPDRDFPASIHFILRLDMKRWHRCDDSHVFAMNYHIFMLVLGHLNEGLYKISMTIVNLQQFILCKWNSVHASLNICNTIKQNFFLYVGLPIGIGYYACMFLKCILPSATSVLNKVNFCLNN